MTENDDFAKLCSRLRELGSSTVGGALDTLGIAGLVVPPIRPVKHGMSFAGPAFTVKVETGPLGTYKITDYKIPAYVDTAEAGEVIVLDVGGEAVSMMGGAAALVAHMRGIAGVLIDGGARDLDEIIDSGLQAFIRHPAPVSGKTRAKTVATQVPVKIASVDVNPGDIVVADSTGVVCFPRDRLQEVLELSEKADAFDRLLMANVRSGMKLKDAGNAARATLAAAAAA